MPYLAVGRVQKQRYNETMPYLAVVGRVQKQRYSDTVIQCPTWRWGGCRNSDTVIQ